MFVSLWILFAFVLQVISSVGVTQNRCSCLISAINGGYVDDCFPKNSWILDVEQSGLSTENHPLCEAWISNNGSDDFIEMWARQFLNSLCFDSFSDKRACSFAVWQTVEKLIAHNVDPISVCHLLKPPYKFSKAMDLWVKGSKIDVVNGKVYVNASAVSCATCTYVMGKVKYLLGQQQVEQRIEDFLYKACRWLGESEPQCNTIIRIDVPALVRWLEHDLSPHSMCHFLRLCTPTEEEKVAPLCPFCSYVMDRIKIELDQKNTIEHIETAVRRVCVSVSHWNDVCQELVNTNMPMLMHLLSAHMDSRYICQKLHACPIGFNNTNKVALHTKATCLLCKPVVFTVKLILNRNGTIPEIEAVLDKFCALFQSDLCTEIVKEYVPEIIELLENNANPEAVCEFLGLCDPKNRTSVIAHRGQPPARLCPLCLLVLRTINEENVLDPSFANIARSLSRICPMTKYFMLDCRKMISGNERTIALRLSRGEDEQSICELINACNTAEEPNVITTDLNTVPLTKFIGYAKTISEGNTEYEKTTRSHEKTKFRASKFRAFDDVLRFHQGDQ